MVGTQEKYAEIRRVRPPMKAGITAEELTQLYWIDEVRTAASAAGIELYRKKEGVKSLVSKATLANKLALHFNGGVAPKARPMPQAPEPPKKKAAPKKKAPAKKAVKKKAAPKKAPAKKVQKRAAKEAPKAKKAAPKKAAPKKAAPKRAAPAARRAAPAPAAAAASPSAASNPFSAANVKSEGDSTMWTYEAKWQYYDAAKPKGPWFDYDCTASDMVEVAYLDWKKNPFVDVRSVKSGQWEYMVDFNEMQQQNVQHSAHTKRKIGRVWVKDGTDALKEQREIKERVRLQRQTSQSSQARSLSRTVSSDTLKRTPSAVGPPRGWRAPKGKEDFKAGAKVKTLAKPTTDYSGYPIGALDKEATVGTAPMGFPPIQCNFPQGSTPASFWFCWEDLLIAE